MPHTVVRNRMIQQLLDYKNYKVTDEVRVVYVFYDVTNKTKVGHFEPGHRFHHTVVDLGRSLLIFTERDGDQLSYRFSYKLGTLQPDIPVAGIPNDYMPCSYCGFDHGYEAQEAIVYHNDHPCSYCSYSPSLGHEHTCPTKEGKYIPILH